MGLTDNKNRYFQKCMIMSGFHRPGQDSTPHKKYNLLITNSVA